MMSKKSVFEYFKPASEISISNPEVGSKSANKIVLVDEGGDRIIFEGSGLTFKNGFVKTGDIDSILIESANGKPAISVTHIELDIATLPSAPIDGLLQYGFTYGLRHDNILLGSNGGEELSGLIGNDVIKGRGGADYLAGNTGNDVLEGGKGEDRFYFQEGDGKDKILDFDADGTDGKQDLIAADDSAIVEMKHVKGNLVFNFGNGDTLTLVGIKANEIDGSDFVL